jgi:hypothetical protein
MKLRLRKNSIRLRLTQGEVAEFAEKGSVEDKVEFGEGSAFRYRLERGGRSGDGFATFDDGCISVSIPTEQGLKWAATEQVGIEATQNTDSGILRILIEKDFTCLDPRPGGEDDDTFPNPQKCGNGAGRDSDILEHSAA